MTIFSVETESPGIVLWAHPGICCKFCSQLTAIPGSSFSLNKPNPTGVYYYFPQSVPESPAKEAGLMFLSTSFTARKRKVLANHLHPGSQSCKQRGSKKTPGCTGPRGTRARTGSVAGALAAPQARGLVNRSRNQSLRGSDSSNISVTSQWRNLGLNINLNFFHL